MRRKDPPIPYYYDIIPVVAAMSQQAVFTGSNLLGTNKNTAAMNSSLLLVQLREREVRADVEDHIERDKDADAGSNVELVSPEVQQIIARCVAVRC